MRDTLEEVKVSQQVTDRRSHPRHQVRSLAYIEFDEGNGGIVLNVSEAGLAVQAVTPLMDEFLSRMSLQLSQLGTPVVAEGRIAWARDSKKMAGIRFLGLTAENAKQIREWIAAEAVPLASRREASLPEEALKAFADSAIGQPGDFPLRTLDSAATTDNPGPFSLMASEAALTNLETEASDPVPSSSSNLASPRAIRTGPDPSKEVKIKGDAGVEASRFVRREPTRSGLSVYILIGVLAVCSTAAGWSVGRTGFYGALEKLTPSRSAGSALSTIASSPGGVAEIRGIEIVDINNSRWLVPFASAAVDPSITTHPHAVVTSPPPPQAKQSVGRLWILGPPVRPSTKKPNNADLDIPPALSTQASGIGGSGIPLSPTNSGIASVPPPASSGPSELSQEAVQPAQLLSRVDPIYPNSAVQYYSTDATIKFHITIGSDGRVQNVTPVSGPPTFFQAAENAIRQWRYRPATVNGKPAVSDGDVSIVFRRSP